MSYTRINYRDLDPFRTSRVELGGIKKITWENKITQTEVDSFMPHLMDEKTKVLIQRTICMPFEVYIVPAAEAGSWADYLRKQKELCQIFNCVYLLWGHDFIYAGKSVNGDRILGHVADDIKNFDYQMLFVPNNENASTMTNWTSDFMSYLESLMIERLTTVENPFCKNLIAGKDIQKSRRDLNLNEDKEAFADNIVDLIFKAFCDITYCTYLVPEEERAEYGNVGCPEDGCVSGKADDEGYLPFWRSIITLSDGNSRFKELVKAQRGPVVYRNMNADRLVASASINCVVTQSTCRVELVGWGGRNFAETNLENFECLLQHKDEIEKEFGCQLKWDRKDGRYTTSISLSKSLRYNDASNGSKRDIADFFSEYFDKFYTIMPRYCSRKEAAEEIYNIDR